MHSTDVIVIGGGASGLMCAWQAALRGRSVLVLEKGVKVGLKILVSGGGRCNFTNVHVDPHQHFLSDNAHFCVSALRRFEPADFIELVEGAGIAYHEKKLGQLFCDESAKQIVALLASACRDAGAMIQVRQQVVSVQRTSAGGFRVTTTQGQFQAPQVVLATGGLSLPKVASDFSLRCAEHFEMRSVPSRPALVPLTWNAADKQRFVSLAGVAVDVSAWADGSEFEFRENLLFTHAGLSGPAILQVSSYWQPNSAIWINWLPELDAVQWLSQVAIEQPQKRLLGLLKTQLPKRFVDVLVSSWVGDAKLGAMHPQELQEIGERLNKWSFIPAGTQGYATAEVTAGGIDTAEVSSKTFAAKKVPGLFVVGEALDVTGWLGGYNFQWAWASGWCCAQYL